jgi:hypothetical protein
VSLQTLAPNCNKRAPNSSPQQSSSLFRYVRHQPHASPKSISRRSALSRGSYADRCTLAALESRPLEQASITRRRHHARTPHTRALKRDSAHASPVRQVNFSSTYRVIRQSVAVDIDVSSERQNTQREIAERCLRSRGPDKRKTAERPRRKAPRLKRTPMRHASRAAERFSRRSA